MDKAHNVALSDIVRLTAMNPPPNEEALLRIKFTTIINEFKACEISDQRLQEVIDDLGRVRPIANVIPAVRPMLTSPEAVVIVCESVIAAWNTSPMKEIQAGSERSHGSTLRQDRNLSDVEANAFDIINRS